MKLKLCLESEKYFQEKTLSEKKKQQTSQFSGNLGEVKSDPLITHMCDGRRYIFDKENL